MLWNFALPCLKRKKRKKEDAEKKPSCPSRMTSGWGGCWDGLGGLDGSKGFHVTNDEDRD